MKSLFKSIFSLLLVCLTCNTIFAASAPIPLSVKSVKVTDNKHIRISFSEAIDPDSVVLKVIKQSDNSTIKLDAVSAVQNERESVDVTLDDALVEGSSYTLTVIAGIGVSGSTITDGASALQDFITPSPLKVFGEQVLNAPSNPNAVLTEPTTTPTNSNTTSSQSEPSQNTNSASPIKEPNPTPTEELPLTGPNTLFFLLLSLPIAYLFLRKKSI